MQMNYTYICTMLLALFFYPSTAAIAEIIEIYSIQDVLDIFKNATKQDLFVFDFDDTLLEPADPAHQTRFRENLELQHIKDSLFTSHKTKTEQIIATSQRLLYEKYQPIEQALINNIKTLQTKQCKTIVLTARKPGPFGEIKQMEKWIYKQLLQKGLDFNSSFNIKPLSFGGIQNSFFTAFYQAKFGANWTPPIFYKGILCSNIIPKGVILKKFLQAINWTPQRLFFFDDQYENAEAVIQSMNMLKIECHAFVYKAATSLNRPESDLDIEATRLQYSILQHTNDYVDYFEIQKISRLNLRLREKKHNPGMLPIILPRKKEISINDI